MCAAEAVALEGRALHTGARARVTLRRRPGPLLARKGGHVATLDELRVVATERATTVARADGEVRIGTVEHLFAAFAGLGVRAGIAVEVEGDELPLLDGGAREWARALRALDPPQASPPLVVAADGDVVVGASRYVFERARRCPSEVSVSLDFTDARLEPRARWLFSADDFVARVAPARTFAFSRDVDDLAARGLAAHVEPESVVVLAPDAVLSAGEGFTPDEPARHKLLDLLGDLFLYGGPPRGIVRAHRPGHASTHAAAAEALARGILVRVPAT